jgi:uncharacterized protein
MMTVLMLALVAAACVVAPKPAFAAPDGVTAADVSFTGDGGVVLHGTVLAPSVEAATRLPGVVLLEGAGNRGRGYLMPEAQAYARHGIVTLVYDKRTAGYDLTHRDYTVLADDALAGVRLLRARADVDPRKVGLWALSEGAFVAPIAARSTDVAFIVTVGAVGTTVAVQTAWAYGQYLRHAGVTGGLVATMQGTAIRATIGAHIFPEANFDPLPLWQTVRQPVLAEWGQLDRDSVPGRSSELIRAALERGGNPYHVIRIVPSVNHNLHVTAADGYDRLPTLPAGYGDYEAAWIADPTHASAAPNASLDPEPDVPAIAAPAWYDAAWAQLATLLIMFGAFLAYPISRRRGRQGLPVARWLAALGPVTVAGTLLYMLFLLVTAAKVTGPVLLGRPVVWLVLQLLTIATVVTTGALGFLLWRRRDLIGARFGLLLTGSMLFLPWAIHWGLLR